MQSCLILLLSGLLYCWVTNDCKMHTTGLWRGESCSGHSDMCVKDTVCDALRVCRKAVDVTCVPDRQGRECVAGARCDRWTCQCDTNVSTQQGKSCVPADGHAAGPCSEGQCNIIAASCDSTQSLCVCDANYTAQRSDFTCALKLGASCELFPSRCVEGAICDFDKVCRLDVEEFCRGENLLLCRLNTMCQDHEDDPTCKLKLGESCFGPWKSRCGKDLICDPRGMCKRPSGVSCHDKGQCTAGANCTDHLVCSCDPTISMPNAQGYCMGTAGQVSGDCTTTTCREAYSDCDNTTHTCACVPGYTISDDLTCMLQAGQSCVKNPLMCVSGSICQHGQCKLKVGCNCPPNSTHCVEGAVCDADLKCIKRAGSTCNTTDDCSAGAVCNEDTQTCQCFENTAYPVGYYCVPLPGEAGSQCSSGEQCRGSHLECDRSQLRCVCKGGVVNQHTYTCALGFGKEPDGMPWSVLWVSMAGSVVVLVLMVGGYRNKEGLADLLGEFRATYLSASTSQAPRKLTLGVLPPIKEEDEDAAFTTGNSDVASTSGNSDVASTSGNSDVASTSGNSDVASTSGNSDVASTAGNSDVASTSGNSDVASTSSDSDVASTSGNSDVASSTTGNRDVASSITGNIDVASTTVTQDVRSKTLSEATATSNDSTLLHYDL